MTLSHSKWFYIIEQLVTEGDVANTDNLDEFSQQEIEDIWDSKNNRICPFDASSKKKKDKK